jgi:hypothetical protein
MVMQHHDQGQDYVMVSGQGQTMVRDTHGKGH